MSIAVGGSSRALVSLSPLCVSVTDRGAVADGSTDCSPAFEAAYAALIAKLSSKSDNSYAGLRGYLRWPAATLPYVIRRPMKIEDPFVYVVGDGPGSRIQSINGNSSVIFGLRTTESYAGGTLQLRNAISSLATAHASTLTVNTGDGPLFGNPTPNYPIRLVVTDSVSGNISIYAAVDRSGDSGRLRYKNAGVGLVQQRIDGGVLNDAYRYASGDFSDTNIIGYLPMADQPSTNRMVTARVLGNNNSYSYFVQNAMFSQLGGLKSNGLTDLHLVGPGFGSVVVIGGTYDLTIERCTIEKGTHAIGTLNLVANYVLQLHDCSLSGSDAGYYGAWQIAEVSNTLFQTCGRVPIRLWASDASIDGVFVTNFGSTYTESIIKMHAGLYGGSYRFEDFTVDFEGEGLSVAPIYLEQHPGTAIVTSCIVKNFYVGSVGNAVAYVQVKTGPFDATHYVQLDVDNFQCGGTTTGVILDIDGPAVTGEVKNVFFRQSAADQSPEDLRDRLKRRDPRHHPQGPAEVVRMAPRGSCPRGPLAGRRPVRRMAVPCRGNLWDSDSASVGRRQPALPHAVQPGVIFS